MNGHDGVFLGIGAHHSREIDLPGRDRVGVSDALEFLALYNRGMGPAELEGQRVVVIGGGDSAIDCARAAQRAGAQLVTIAYRGDAEQMSANQGERDLAASEGVGFLFGHQPL